MNSQVQDGKRALISLSFKQLCLFKGTRCPRKCLCPCLGISVLRLLSMPDVCWSSTHVGELWALNLVLLGLVGDLVYQHNTAPKAVTFHSACSILLVDFCSSFLTCVTLPLNCTEFPFSSFLIDLPDLSFKSMILFSPVHQFIHSFNNIIECQMGVKHFALCYNKIYGLMRERHIWQRIPVLNRQL